MLIKYIPRGQYAALCAILTKWAKDGDINYDQTQVMWEQVTLKHLETTESDSRAALMLLDIISE